MDCETCEDLVQKIKVKTLANYKKTKACFVYDAKNYRRLKVRLADDGHLTHIPSSIIYSGSVASKGMLLVLFLADLNGLESWGADKVNICLEAESKEKECILACSDINPLNTIHQ